MGSFLSSDTLELNINDAEIGYRPSNLSNTVDCLVHLLEKYKGNVTVITGAGISSHQLPTFRSHDKSSGLWDKSFFTPTILDKCNFYQNPSPCWKLVANLRNLQVRKNLHPSLSHHVLHYLLRNNFINSIITQNIDSLHNFAGDDDKVIELHGVVNNQALCEKCNKVLEVSHTQFEHILQAKKIDSEVELPHCPVCNSILKPLVAFFGDAIDERLKTKAQSFLNFSNVVILVGTHCSVDPVCSLVAQAKRTGTILVELNKTQTPASSFVDVSILMECDQVFKEVGKKLLNNIIDVEHINLEKWETNRF